MTCSIRQISSDFSTAKVLRYTVQYEYSIQKLYSSDRDGL